MFLAQWVWLFNAYSPTGSAVSSSACNLDWSLVIGGRERVVPTSRLVTGVSSGTKVGSLLISRDSENCGAVEGVSISLGGLLFGVPGTCCLFSPVGTGIVTGRYAISTCSSFCSDCLPLCFLAYLSHFFPFQIPCLNAFFIRFRCTTYSFPCWFTTR
jgi:hypothetical protein